MDIVTLLVVGGIAVLLVGWATLRDSDNDYDDHSW